MRVQIVHFIVVALNPALTKQALPEAFRAFTFIFQRLESVADVLVQPHGAVQLERFGPTQREFRPGVA
jgi:hypothetical protein